MVSLRHRLSVKPAAMMLPISDFSLCGGGFSRWLVLGTDCL